MGSPRSWRYFFIILGLPNFAFTLTILSVFKGSILLITDAHQGIVVLSLKNGYFILNLNLFSNLKPTMKSCKTSAPRVVSIYRRYINWFIIIILCRIQYNMWCKITKCGSFIFSIHRGQGVWLTGPAVGIAPSASPGVWPHRPCWGAAPPALPGYAIAYDCDRQCFDRHYRWKFMHKNSKLWFLTTNLFRNNLSEKLWSCDINHKNTWIVLITHLIVTICNYNK